MEKYSIVQSVQSISSNIVKRKVRHSNANNELETIYLEFNYMKMAILILYHIHVHSTFLVLIQKETLMMISQKSRQFYVMHPIISQH